MFKRMVLKRGLGEVGEFENAMKKRSCKKRGGLTYYSHQISKEKYRDTVLSEIAKGKKMFKLSIAT